MCRHKLRKAHKQAGSVGRGHYPLLQGVSIHTRAPQRWRKTLHTVAHHGIAEFRVKLHAPGAGAHAKRVVGFVGIGRQWHLPERKAGHRLFVRIKVSGGVAVRLSTELGSTV